MYRDIVLALKLRQRGYSVRRMRSRGEREWWIYKDIDDVHVGAYRKTGNGKNMLVYVGYDMDERTFFGNTACDLSLSFRYIIETRDDRILFKKDGVCAIGRNLRNKAFHENLMD